MASMQLRREDSLRQSPRSPEAQVGLQVEDLWDVLEPQLPPTEKLNACFENIPISSFPSNPSQVIEIKSNTSLAEAVQILAQNKIYSAPVVNENVTEDASWMDRYIGIVEFAGIAVWILQQSDPQSPRSPISSKKGTDFAVEVNGLDKAAAFAKLSQEPAWMTSGDFFESLTSSDYYKSTTVRDISGSYRWAPFLALQDSNSFLTMLLLLSKYKMKSVPVVDFGYGRIQNIITQSAVIHMLAECAGLQWFENWGTKKLSEIGLPVMSRDQIISVNEDEPVLQAFKVMREKRLGGLPVVESGSQKAVDNINLRDIQYLLTAPEIYHDYRTITAKNFLVAVRNHIEKQGKESAMSSGVITCTRDNTMKDLIMKLDSEKINRIYVVDDKGKLEGVITLRDIISKLVHEPPGYFGDFFDGMMPLPANSRV